MLNKFERHIKVLKENAEGQNIRDYVERLAEAEPGFFRWLFNNSDWNDYELPEEHKAEYNAFLECLMTPADVAKALIIEAQQVGPADISIWRSNTGIAGRIATKIILRKQWNENNQRLDIDQQAELLALRLEDEEIEYAKKMMR